jgi:hypothetical protein
MLAVCARLVSASCCYTSVPSFISPYNFYLTVTSTSNNATDTGSQSVTLAFPSIYDVSIPSNTSTTSSCTLSTTANTYTCKGTSSSVSGYFRLHTPDSSNAAPSVTVTMFGENCGVPQNYCPDLSVKDQTQSSGSSVNLGPFGVLPAQEFYPILVVVILFILGLSYLAYKRSRKGNEHDLNSEELMTRGGNGAGWFGEKRRQQPREDDVYTSKLVGAKNANGQSSSSQPANANHAGAASSKSAKLPVRAGTSSGLKSLSGDIGSGLADLNRQSLIPQSSVVKWDSKTAATDTSPPPYSETAEGRDAAAGRSRRDSKRKRTERKLSRSASQTAAKLNDEESSSSGEVAVTLHEVAPRKTPSKSLTPTTREKKVFRFEQGDASTGSESETALAETPGIQRISLIAPADLPLPTPLVNTPLNSVKSRGKQAEAAEMSDDESDSDSSKSSRRKIDKDDDDDDESVDHRRIVRRRPIVSLDTRASANASSQLKSRNIEPLIRHSSLSRSKSTGKMRSKTRRTSSPEEHISSALASPMLSKTAKTTQSKSSDPKRSASHKKSTRKASRGGKAEKSAAPQQKELLEDGFAVRAKLPSVPKKKLVDF